MTHGTSKFRLSLLSGNDRSDVAAVVSDLAGILKRSALVDLAGVYSLTDAVPEPFETDLLVVVGGDGSMLRGCRWLGTRQKTHGRCHLGRLGFYNRSHSEEFSSSLSMFADRRFRIVDHLMLACEHLASDGTAHRDLVLNEVTITSAGSLKMLDIQLQIDGEDVTTFSCDGLIVSTPVGSTAHNLSAEVRSCDRIFAPLPLHRFVHTLTVRPLVESSDRVYHLSLKEPPDGVRLVIDGQIQRPILPGDRIIVRQADSVFQLLRLPGHSYYGTLHRKLGWKGQIEYRERRATNF